MMKKVLATLALAMVTIIAVAQNDSTSVLTAQDIPTLTARDSLVLKHLYRVMSNANSSTLPRYKLYKTENIYNLIKLDTATGELWQVQYGMNKNSNRMEVVIDETSLLWDFEEPVAGRYELYPTNNVYTFILLDTVKGYAYQVQWNTDPDRRFRIRIY